MAGMNIAEKRKTQDGRIKAKVDNRIIDFRVNAVPAIDGEKIVLRILDRGNLQFDLRELGFPEDALKAFMAGGQFPLWNSPGHRPHRKRQDHHPLLRPELPEHPGGEHTHS